MVFKIQAQSRSILALLTVTVLVLAGCGKPKQVETPGQDPVSIVGDNKTILVDGSSTVYPITNEIAKQYLEAKKAPNVRVKVDLSGTSGGFKKFCEGETDISNASRPISKKEIEACNQSGVRYLELPVAYDALTIVVNPKNTWAKDITMTELEKIWEPAAQGKIKSWKQVRESYPDKPLKLYSPGKDSGTFDYFTSVTTGKEGASREDIIASEDDEILAAGVSEEANALGYFGFAYFEEHRNKLKALPVDSGKGSVEPSRENVEKAKYQPFSRPLFIYVNYKAAQEKPIIEDFVRFYLKNARDTSIKVGYVPLPDEAYHIAQVQFNKGKVGTVFAGVPQPNLTIPELLRKQATF